MLKILVAAWVAVTLCMSLPTWGTYRPGTLFTLLNVATSQSLQFGVIENQQVKSSTSSITEDYNQQDIRTMDDQVSQSKFLVHDCHSIFHKQIRLKNKDTFSVLGISDATSAQVVFQIESLHNNTYYFLQTISQSHIMLNRSAGVVCQTKKVKEGQIRSAISKIVDFEQLEEGENSLISCHAIGSQRFNITFTVNSKSSLINEVQITNINEAWTTHLNNFERKLKSFMHQHNIPQEKETIDIVRHGLSNTLSNIAVQKGFVSNVYGLMDQEGIFDIKYSMLVIEVLSGFDYGLAYELMNNTIEYLEDKIIYGEEILDELPCPQHIQAILKFPNDKALKIVNGIVFRTIFQRVNRVIGKEQDYMSSKKVHPVLMTMLEIRWHSKFNYLAANSIYTQSFLYDLYINGLEETQDISVSKFAWLLKTIDVLKKLNLSEKKPLSQVQIDSLQSLMTKYLADECVEKTNHLFRSINKVGRNRYYSKYLSIESTLPHVYQLYNKSEQTYVPTLQLIYNITSENGVMSTESGIKNDFDSYILRGNISPYFNYKLLKMLQKEQPYNRAALYEKYKNNPNVNNMQELLHGIENTLGKVRGFELNLIETIKKNVRGKVLKDWRQQGKLFGWWAPTGKSYQPNSHLIILNTLFL